MTLEEQKLAVASKLPEVICPRCSGHSSPRWKNPDAPINWPTEGLQVCAEAEKLINDCIARREYYQTLDQITGDQWLTIVATYEQRLEALCRVWFPERFE